MRFITFALLLSVCLGTTVRAQQAPPSVAIRLSADEVISVDGVMAKEHHHTFRLLLIGVSKLFLNVNGERAAKRMKAGALEFHIPLPEGTSNSSIALVRLATHDGSREVRFSRKADDPFGDDDTLPMTFSASPDPAGGAAIRSADVKYQFVAGEYALVVGRMFYPFGID